MTQIERVSREIIDDQLLTALDDKSKVAIVADEEMLDMIYSALHYCLNDGACSDDDTQKVQLLLRDLEKLREAAFGNNIEKEK